jgi:hypothetical protein
LTADKNLLLAAIALMFMLVGNVLGSMVVGARRRYGVKHPITYPSEHDVTYHLFRCGRKLFNFVVVILGQEPQRSIGVHVRGSRTRKLPGEQRAVPVCRLDQLDRKPLLVLFQISFYPEICRC